MTTIINLLTTYINDEERVRVAQSILLLNENKSARVSIHDKSGKIVKYRDIPSTVMFGALAILLDAYDKHHNNSIKSYTNSKGELKEVDGYTLDYVYNTVNAYTDKDNKRAYQLPISLLSIARAYFNIDCLNGKGLRKTALLDSTKEKATSIIDWAKATLNVKE